jgi:WD40 repeat protein
MDMKNGELLKSLSPEGHFIRALHFLPDGRLVSGDETALVWKVDVPEK